MHVDDARALCAFLEIGLRRVTAVNVLTCGVLYDKVINCTADASKILRECHARITWVGSPGRSDNDIE